MNFISKFISLLDRKQRLQVFGLMSLMFIGTGFEVAGVGLIMPFIIFVQDTSHFSNYKAYEWIVNQFHLSNHEMVIWSGIVLLFIYIFKNSFLAFLYNIQFRFVYNLEVLFSGRLLTAYLYSPYTLHLQKNSAGILKNVTIEILYAFNQVLVPLLILISELMVAIALMITLFFVDPVIAIASITVLGSMAYLFFRVIRKKTGDLGRMHQIYYEQMIKWISQGLGGLKETKILGRESFFIDAFILNMYKLSRVQLYPQIMNQMPRLFVETLAVGALLIIVIITQARGQNLNTIAPVLALFAMAVFRLMPSINRILSMLTTLRYHKASVDVVHADLVSLGENANNVLLQITASHTERFLFKQSIEFKDVIYQYPETSRPAVRGISFSILKGQSVAIVGPTGSGKTTIVDILLGLLKPTSGSIFIDGLDVYKNISGWQRNIGYVPQFIYLIDDAIKRNVAFGLPDEQIDEARVWQVLKAAQLESFVKNLPEKLETSVGERGVRLSGGERQRIGIARALYHNPEVLVMDEATSSLDNETEAAVTQAIENLSGLKTLIIIAHRLTTVKKCDMIYMINDGILADRVTYNKLISKTCGEVLGMEQIL